MGVTAVDEDQEPPPRAEVGEPVYGEDPETGRTVVVGPPPTPQSLSAGNPGGDISRMDQERLRYDPETGRVVPDYYLGREGAGWDINDPALLARLDPDILASLKRAELEHFITGELERTRQGVPGSEILTQSLGVARREIGESQRRQESQLASSLAATGQGASGIGLGAEQQLRTDLGFIEAQTVGSLAAEQAQRLFNREQFLIDAYINQGQLDVAFQQSLGLLDAQLDNALAIGRQQLRNELILMERRAELEGSGFLGGLGDLLGLGATLGLGKIFNVPINLTTGR